MVVQIRLIHLGAQVLIIVVVGNFSEHFIEFTGFLTNVDHVDDKFVDNTTGTQWFGDGKKSEKKTMYILS